MGWFNEQIKERINNDNNTMASALAEMAGVITGKAVADTDYLDDAKNAKDAVEEILKYYRVPVQELPVSVKEVDEVLEFLLRPTGIMHRTVQLDNTWFKDGVGAFLCMTHDGVMTAAIPTGRSGYTYYDRNLGKRVSINAKNASLFINEAICFYKPFPLKELKTRDIITYMMNLLSAGDYISVAASTLAVTIIGLFTAYVNNIIFSSVINSKDISLLIAAGVFMLGVLLSGTCIKITKSIIISGITTKTKIPIESATMMRIMSLPANFFKAYGSGELTSRAQSMNSLCNLLVEIILSTGLSSLLSIVYIFQIVVYSPTLAFPAIVLMLITLLFAVVSTIVQMKYSKMLLEAKAKESGFVFSLLSGIQKVKVSGAEKRAFAKWSGYYKKVLEYKYRLPKFLIINGALSTFISVVGTAAIYFIAITKNIAVPEYMSFNAAYGMLMGSFVQIVGMAIQIADIKPTLEMVKPIFETVPEVSLDKKIISRLSGSIELNNVSFRYDENMPNVIDNLSLKIRSGQYVAIVGTTGCGKSTLMRLMLGFETPQKGAVYYDGNDLNRVDLKSLRKNIGTVLQSGKLFSGDIYSNIVISNPKLSLDQAWEAAEMAGIADDIRAMPMQMHTIISEGAGGISGGQRQRLMIARAIAPKPKILMLDEATSALDNITQKKVAESLSQLRCTRIVIAHRLSTIKDCDRIIVLDKGKIVGDDSYENLIKSNEFFAELVARQRID